mgnify:CR=1 FL=1
MKRHSSFSARAALALALAVCLTAGCAPQAGSGEFSFGTWDQSSQRYTNTSLDYTLPLPRGWNILPEDQRLALTGAKPQDVANQQKLRIYLADFTALFDVVISAPAGIPRVSVVVENNAKGSVAVNKPEDYCDAMKRQLSGTGTSYEFGSYSARTIGGQQFLLMPVLNKEHDLHQDYYVRLQGPYAVCFFTVYTSAEKAQTDAVLDSVTPAEAGTGGASSAA